MGEGEVRQSGSPSVEPDKTVYHNLGFEGFGGGANLVAVDVKDGKLVRIRPAHYTDYYTPEDLNAWQLVGANGKTFDPGMKSLTPAFPMVYKNRTYSNNRVPYPLKRVDWDPNGERHPEMRGISKYERISWDEALDIIANEIKRVHDEYGPFSILCMADGHGESKNIHASHGCMTPLLEACGGFTSQNRNPDSWEGWYWGAKHAWGMDPVGQNVFATNIAQDIAQNADALLYWGCDLETTTWAWGGHQASRLAFWFTECGVKSIAIAPDCNYTTAIHADKWIPVLPNTDAALQLAIAYVWWSEGTYEKEYIDTHTEGFDWFVYYLSGEESGEPNDAKKIGVIALFSTMANKNADYISELAKHGYMVYPYLTFYDEVLVSSRSRFASQDSLTCDEIKNEPFVLLNADLKEVVDLEMAPSYCTLVPDSRFQRKLVESTEAISITPSINRLNAGGSLDSGLVQVPLVDGWEVTLAFVGNTGILDYDPVKRMVKALSVGYDHQDEAGGRRFILHFGNRLPG